MSSGIDVAQMGPRVFVFRTVSRDGSICAGTVHAADAASARREITRDGGFILQLQAESKSSARHRIGTRALADGLRLLGSLLDAQLPIGRALAAFRAIAPAGWAASVVDGVIADVRQGTSLARALAAHATDLPSGVTGMLVAAESSGRLADGLTRVAAHLEEEVERRTALRDALAYPALLAIASIGSAVLLVGVVLPKFALILADLGSSIPPSTQILLELGALVRLWIGPAALVTAVAILWFCRWIAQTPDAQRQWHAFLLRTWIVGSLRLELAGARAAATTGMALQNGVPLPAALRLAAQATSDAEVRARLDRISSAVIEGVALSSAATAHAAFPQGAPELIRAGELVGNLAFSLERAGAIATRHAAARIRALVRFVEPALILLLGLWVAFIAASLLQAVYAVRPAP